MQDLITFNVSVSAEDILAKLSSLPADQLRILHTGINNLLYERLMAAPTREERNIVDNAPSGNSHVPKGGITDEIAEEIKRIYATTSNKEIAKRFNLAPHTLTNFACKHGLAKNAEYLSQVRGRRPRAEGVQKKS